MIKIGELSLINGWKTLVHVMFVSKTTLRFFDVIFELYFARAPLPILSLSVKE